MNKQEIIQMLNIQNYSDEYFQLLDMANKKTRKDFNSKGYIFSQIGINGKKCSGNCKFCSMAKDYYSLENEFEKSKEEILCLTKEIATHKVSDIFLMTTEGYSLNKYLDIGQTVKKSLPENINLVANIGDFSLDTANALKESGFCGCYHIKRLREGIDTDINPKTREQTIQNIIDSGLEIYYCIEPIGPEHSYDEIADEIVFASELNVGAMAVMRRIAVPNTATYSRGQISKGELLKIGAVTLLATNPTRSMNIHETVEGSLLAGVNQLYAEFGANPRDVVNDTVKCRGLTVQQAEGLLTDYGYKI